MEKNTDTILELAILHFQGKISTEQEELLKMLLSNDEENREIFNNIKESWIASSGYQQKDIPVDTYKSWDKIHNKINSVSEEGDITPDWRNNLLYRILRTAAVWILLISVGATASWFLFQKKQVVTQESYSEILVPMGSRTKVLLPDSTSVWLNAGSKLRYSQNSFLNNREVYLEGEAYFDVTRSDDNLFVVKTTDINVKVYGTQFNIKSYPEEYRIQTTLIKGSVTIEETDNVTEGNEVLLKPNQTAVYYKTTKDKMEEIVMYAEKAGRIIDGKSMISNLVIYKESNPITRTSWKDNIWVIMNKKFGQLATEMERRYNVKITFQDESLKDFKFTGKLKDETFEQVMKIIQLSAPVRFRYIIENNNVIVKY